MYKISWKPKAARQLEKIKDAAMRHRIFNAVELLIHFPKGQNIKMLRNHEYEYRLRIGRYRVLFNVNETIHIVSIEEVKKRDEHTY